MFTFLVVVWLIGIGFTFILWGLEYNWQFELMDLDELIIILAGPLTLGVLYAFRNKGDIDDIMKYQPFKKVK